MSPLKPWLDRCPLIAILRGIKPNEVVAIGNALADHGVAIIEVPLNSPAPLDSIAALVRHFGERLLIGAGTILSGDEARAVADAGGRLAVMPHCDTAVIRAARAANLITIPGFFTPTEAFAAIAAGADGLKLFPAEAASPSVLKALKAVLPPAVPILPVGGISADNMTAYRQAGAAGFGLGSSLYKPGDAADTVAKRARKMIQAIKAPLSPARAR